MGFSLSVGLRAAIYLLMMQAGCARQQQEASQQVQASQACSQQQQQQHEGTVDASCDAGAGLPQERAAAEELQQLKACVVCLDAPRSVLLLPCKHLALCEGCAQQLQQQHTAGGDSSSSSSAAGSNDAGSAAVPCPVCRVPSTQCIPGVFFS
jgi:hypothetical protein